MDALLWLTIVFPLGVALLLGTKARRYVLLLIPASALVAIGVALLPYQQLSMPWLLLGSRIGTDAVNVVFLLLAGVLWSISALFARGYMADKVNLKRFYLFFLLSMAGNLGAILALDLVSFYTFFAMMTFCAYGMIIQDGRDSSLRAGKVYLVLAIMGEALLLAGMFTIGRQFGNVDLQQLPLVYDQLANPTVTAGLLMAGFAVKMGAVPVHVWLALAHPSAPVPASAVLSGVIIKTGLLGWLRFLPLGTFLVMDGLGVAMVIMGVVSAIFGAVVGMVQRKPKTVLAYSSISQMGLVTCLVGLGLLFPHSWEIIFAVLLIFILHHGLAKSALFLGVGMTSHHARYSGPLLLIPALALAGFPFTSGFLAKGGFKEVVSALPHEAISLYGPVLLSLSTVLTTLLLARFVFLAWPERARAGTFQASLLRWCTLPWLLNIWLLLLLPFFAAHFVSRPVLSQFSLGSLLEGALTILAAAAFAWLLWRFVGTLPRWARIREGDLLNPVTGWLNRLLFWLILERSQWLFPKEKSLPQSGPMPLEKLLIRLEAYLCRTPLVGIAVLLLLLGLVALFVAGN